MSNINDLKPIQNLKPFTKFCCSIGAIPTSYLISMTYEEQLLWLCDYLKNTVIPTLNTNGEAVTELQNLYIQLKNYVDNYFTNLNVQNEINNKLDEMASSGELQRIFYNYLSFTFTYDTVENMKNSIVLNDGTFAKTLGYYSINDGGQALYKIHSYKPENLYGLIELNNGQFAELITNNPNAKMFGAINTNENDMSNKIKEAINYCSYNNINILELNGQYFINNTINVENVNNLTIKNGTINVHETNETLNNFNIFNFSNCKNIKIENIHFIELNSTERSRKLEVGGIIFNNCDKCSIENCYFENTMSGIILKSTNNSKIINNIIKVDFQSQQFAQSAILNYASNNNIISKNIIYGEFYDGTLSVFGAGSSNVIVDSNQLYNKIGNNAPSYLSQGITIDSGVRNCECINNIIHDMFYGIDNKSDTKNTLISNNTLIGCKISIADRNGENAQSPQTFNTSILNNKIVIQKDYETTIGTYLHYGIYYYVGILSEKRLGCKIKNNDITVYNTGNNPLDNKPILGIDTSFENSTNVYIQNSIIEGNNIEFSSGFGGYTANAPTNSAGIVINNCKKGIYSNNTFKVDNSNNNYSMIIFKDNNNTLLICNNNCIETNISKHNFYSKDENSKVSNSIIVDNMLLNSNTPNLNDYTNNVQHYGYMNKFKSHEITPTLEWQNAFRIFSQYSNGCFITLEYGQSYAGNKYLHGTYYVEISKDNVSFHSLNEDKNGIEIQFIHGNDNQAICQLKGNANFPYGNVLKILDFRPVSPTAQYIINE